MAKAWTHLTTVPPKAEVVRGSAISFQDIRVALQRTLRIPNDGKTYPLPAGFGEFPLFSVERHDLPKDVKAQGWGIRAP